jgi:1-phosphofructokinase
MNSARVTDRKGESAMQLTAICMNPCVDRTVEVERFEIGATNRILGESSEGAGKGVNVTVVAQRLGMQAACVGLLAQAGGEPILERLAREGVQAAFARAPGRVRVNLKVRDLSRHVITEINEPGPQTSAALLDQVREEALRHASKSDYLILTGSLPPGCPEDFYTALMAEVPQTCRCVVDVAGDRLVENLRGKPYLIKPNLTELEQASGRRLSTLRDIRDAALVMVDAGVALVAVSMGSEGALLTDGKLTLFAPGISVPVYSTVCAGDSMIAGIIKGLREGGGLKQALRCGVAAATATVADARDGLMQYAAYEEICQSVKVGVL